LERAKPWAALTDIGPGRQPTWWRFDCLVFALVGTLVLLKVVDLIVGIRVPEEHEIEGLDITQHGEEAYKP